MNSRTRTMIVAFVLLILIGLIAGSIVFTSDDDDNSDGTATNDGDSATDVTLFLTFVPNIQFAPMYVALEQGYFTDEGLNITIEHGAEPDGIDRIAVNDLQFGIISGEQVILARQAEKPVVYVMEWYHRFPVGVVVPADSDIESPEDLAGKHVSVSFFNGASYMGLLGLLGAVDVDAEDLELEAIGFNAPGAMCERDVDAAVVYIANEPLQIEQCYDVRVLEISDYVSIVSNGLITNEQTIRDNPELVESMVRAMQRGIAFTIANPDQAFDMSLNYLEDLAEDQYDIQRQVLLNSIDLWEADTIGLSTDEAWENTQAALLAADLLEEPLSNLDEAYTNAFVHSITEE